MECFVGSSIGTFKVIDLKNSKCRNVNSLEGLKPKEHGITSMCFLDKSENEVLVAQRNGQINAFSVVLDTYTSLFEAGMELKCIQASKNNSIVTASESGSVSIWTTDGECTSSKIKAGEGLECLRVDPLNLEVSATGGRENPLKLWDLERGESVFTSKNVKDSSLSLRVPIWVTNVRFVNDSKQICVSTGHHQLRLYDPKAQRRPVLELKWLDKPITALSTCHRNAHVVAGNSSGDLALFDLRNKIRPIQKYKGFTGSIRSIHAHPTEPLMAACGIDRFLMVHNIETRKVMNKIYCKTKLSSVLFHGIKTTENSIKEECQTEIDPVNEFFDN